MGAVIKTTTWEMNPAVFFFPFVACLLSVFLPYFIFLRVQSRDSFAVEGLSSVSGEFEFSMLGVNKEQIVSFLCIGVVASLAVGTFFGILSNALGQKKFIMIFFFLHIFVGVLKKISRGSPLWLASICLSLASSISVSKHGWYWHEKVLAVSLLPKGLQIGSSVLRPESLTSPSIAVICLAALGIAFVVRGWKRSSQAIGLHSHDMSYTLLFKDKRVVLLIYAQASIQFSGTVFGILWSPTLVADGRDLRLSLIYPCLMEARMLGSAIFPWLTSASMPFRAEDYLAYAFMMLLHMTTRYVLNNLRGGMIGSSLALSNAALLLFMVQRGYYHGIGSIWNSTMMAFAVIGLFTAAGCMHALKWLGKQP